MRQPDNHALSQEECAELQRAVSLLLQTRKASVPKEVSFTVTEERLGVTLPCEVKILYSALIQAKSLFAGSERFLPLEELYIDEGNLVFYKIKRTPVALSLERRVLMGYHKKTWEYSSGGISFLCFVLERMSVWSIMEMPFHKKGRVKGKMVSVLCPKPLLEQIFAGKLQILEQYRNYGNVLLYHPNGALGWFRQNGFYADMLIGSWDQAQFDQLLSTDLSVTWETS